MRPTYALLLLPFFLAGCDSPESSANQLYVEASQVALQASSELDPLRRYELLQAASQSVQRITTQYPTTAAALRVAANENIGPYTFNALADALADASAAPVVCAANLRQDCFLAAVNASFKHIAGATAEVDKRHLDIASMAWPYAKLWEPNRLTAIFAKEPDTVSDIGVVSARKDLAAFLLNMHDTRGLDVTVTTLTEFMTDPPVGQRVRESFSAFWMAVLSRRPSMTYPDMLRLASLTEAPISEDTLNQAAKHLCDLSGVAAADAPKLAQCPANAVIRSSILFDALTPEQADNLFAAANADNRRKLAQAYYDALFDKPDVQMKWLPRAGFNTDPEKLCALYAHHIREGIGDPKAVAKYLAAIPEPVAETPLAKVGITSRNLCLMHASGAFATQLPVILLNLQSIPQFSQEVYDRFRTVIDLAGSTPAIDLVPVITSAKTVTSRWQKQDASKDFIGYAIMNAVLQRKGDPVPLLTRYFEGDGFLKGLGYKGLLRIRDAGHQDIFERAMAPDSKYSFREKELRSRLETMRDTGDVGGFLAAFAKETDEGRINLIGVLFSARDGTGLRGPVYNAVLERYPAQFLRAQHRNGSADVGLTPEERVRIFIAHPDVLQDTHQLSNDWIIQGMRTLPEPEQRKAVQTLAALDPVAWLDAAGWYLLKHTP